MKVTTEIDVTPKQYFEHLCNTMIKDIKDVTKAKITIDDLINGYSYDREVKNKERKLIVHLKIGPLMRDKYFLVEYETDATKCYYYYDFAIKDGKYYVTYCEETGYVDKSVGTFIGNLRKSFSQKVIEEVLKQHIKIP